MSNVDKTKPMIGLEIHCQLNKLKSKLFCGCNAQFRGEEPNKYTCPVCLGLPGGLPVLNKGAVDAAIKLAHAFNSKINNKQYFFRKNYFYPDLACGYQITEYNKGGGVAFADGGSILIKMDNNEKDIELDRFHLENDPGKIVHMGGDIESSKGSLVDYNRSGIALVEVVTKPVMEKPEEVRLFLNKLKSIISHCDLIDLTKDGAMRVDVNVSITGHARIEVKNINSFKEAEKAVKWEIYRQKKMLEKGQEPIQSTRNWNGQTTSLLRAKESESEYRYFPEADLIPLSLDDDWIQKIKDDMPELPDARSKRFRGEYRLNEYDANVLMGDKYTADFYEESCNLNDDYQTIKNWLMNDIMGLLNEENKSLEESEVTPKLLVEMVKALNSKKITTKIAKKYVPKLLEGIPLKKWMKKKGVKKVTDPIVLGEFADKIIEENPSVVEDLKKKPKTFQFFIGQMMKATRGQADIQLTRKILQEKLEKYMDN